MKRVVSAAWPLLAVLLALGWFLPTLGHGFRSDDFLTVYYYDREAGAVQWGRVFEEWLRPWFGVRDLYRPWVSLSFGVNWALSPAPFGFHLLNVLLLGTTALAVAGTAARLGPARPRLAGLVAAAVVVLHPAAVEPTAWIAARTTGWQVAWSAVALWTFVRWRDGHGGRWWHLLATALACASKEGAVLLPLSLLAVDLLRGGRLRVTAHLPEAALVAGYLLFRWWLLGTPTTHADPQSLGTRLATASGLLRQLLLPPGDGMPVVFWTGVPCLLWVVSVAVAARRTLWVAPWVVLLMLPGTTHVVLQGHELAGRFVFDAVPALGIGLGVALAGARQWRPALWLATAVLLGAFAVGSRVQLAGYDAGDRTIAAVQQELLTRLAGTTPARPVGVVGLPKLPLLQPALWGFLWQRPFLPQDLPVVGLDAVLTRDPAAAGMFGDATPIHALVANGGGFARWNGDLRRFELLPPGGDQPLELVRDPAQPGRFVPPRLVPPTAVAAVEVTAPAPVTRLDAAILGNLDGEYAAAPFRLAGAPGRTRWLDTTRVLPWVVAAAFGGGPAGIDVTLDGAAPAPGTVVTAHAGLPTVTWSGPRDRVVARRDLAAALDWPLTADPAWSLPRRADRAHVVYLLLPNGIYRLDVAAGLAVDVPNGVLEQVGFGAELLGGCRVHWSWQEVGAPEAPPRRSTFATAIVR